MDLDADARIPNDQNKVWKTNLMRELKFLILRLPSLILADVFLSQTDYFYDELQRRFQSLFNYFLLLIIAKIFTFFGLFICSLLFTLNTKYVIRIYKIMGLVSLPFLFTYLMEYAHKGELLSILHISLPVKYNICIVYVFLSSLTIVLYNDIYENLICDKYNIHQNYQENRNQTVDGITDYIARLNRGDERRLNDINNNDDNQNEQANDNVHRFWTDKNKRRFYIAFYSFLSLIVNEATHFTTQSDLVNPDSNATVLNGGSSENSSEGPLNIMSLGYLILLTYDLSVNLDQILLRILIQIRLFSAMISEYGLHNILAFNWFDRFRIPYILRLYFFLKCALFAFNFIFYFNHYYDCEVVLQFENRTENYSLFNSLASFFMDPTELAEMYESEKLDIEEKSLYLFNMTKTDTPNLLASYVVSFGFSYIHSSSLFSSTSFSEYFSDKIHNDLTEQYDINLFNLTCLFFKMILLDLSNNLICIAATTSILSYKFYLFGVFVNKILTPSNSIDQTPNNAQRDRLGLDENDQQQQQMRQQPANANANGNEEFSNIGEVAAILFFLLSIQSGLSSLNGSQRVDKFLKNYSLLFIAILHFLHTGLDAQLTNLSASSNPHWFNKKHSRLLSVCLSLIIVPSFILFILWRYFKISTWLLAATAFNIELIIKMSVSLVLYGLFLFDSKRIKSAYDKLVVIEQSASENGSQDIIDELSDNLDDYIYYIKAFGSIVEFLVAIFLFFNGAYILFFESYGAVRAIMMCIHAYFHIWSQAIKGWSVFMKRRTAISKLKQMTIFNKTNYISLLKKQNQPTANDDDNAINYDAEFDEKSKDFCAICYCELYVHDARITTCNHIFHIACLRKWLYLSDLCPMCHQLVYQSTAK